MHPNNKHNAPYNFDHLAAVCPELTSYIIDKAQSKSKQASIDYSNSDAVYQLNRALLIADYGLKDWNLPNHALAPAVPGRADYIHALYDLLHHERQSTPSQTITDQTIKGLDIGVGANAIYSLLAHQIYGWTMVGADINAPSVEHARYNVSLTPTLNNAIDIRHQQNPSNIFIGIINADEYFDVSLCNPPFYRSEDDAIKTHSQKASKLGLANQNTRNFQGQAHELWCNGGEALFIKRMIKQSVQVKSQVGWFTSLVSKSENLANIIKLLNKHHATHRIIDMSQGHKKSRFVAWRFD